MSENPLKQYFRTAAIHLALPSNGDYYADGALEMPEAGEVPVMPMTALDEITYKTPDALFNGSAVADVIKSCVPSIIDPWAIPIIDLTAILTAIRIASFGHNMDIATTCPKCENTADYKLDLRVVLDTMVKPNYTEPLKLGDLTIYFKPMVYKDLNDNNKLQFEEQKMSALLASNEEIGEEEQIKLLSEAFRKVSEYTINTLAKNIKSITTPEGTTTDQEHINEFLRACENELYKKIKEEVIKQKGTEELKPLKIKCSNEECGHEYEQPFTMDMTSFFEQSS